MGGDAGKFRIGQAIEQPIPGGQALGGSSHGFLAKRTQSRIASWAVLALFQHRLERRRMHALYQRPQHGRATHTRRAGQRHASQ
jgi:hypothetical protein